MLNKPLYYKLFEKTFDTDILKSNLGTINIVEDNRITKDFIDNKLYTNIPYFKFIKWVIPNPIADINVCLDDLRFKNMKKDNKFNMFL